MFKKKENTVKEKASKEKNLKKSNDKLFIIIIILVALETIAILVFAGLCLFKNVKTAGKYYNTYTANGSKSLSYFDFKVNGKFEYGTGTSQEDATKLFDGKFKVIDKRVILEYEYSGTISSIVLYRVEDYYCVGSAECEESLRYYVSSNKKALEFKTYGEESAATEEVANLTPVYTTDSQPTIYIFHGDGCPHCAELLDWIKDFKYSKGYKVKKYEVWNDSDNSALMQKVGAYLKKEVSGVPFVVIGDQVISGFSSSSTPSEIKKALDSAYKKIESKELLDAVKTVQQKK